MGRLEKKTGKVYWVGPKDKKERIETKNYKKRQRCKKKIIEGGVVANMSWVGAIKRCSNLSFGLNRTEKRREKRRRGKREK